MGIYQCDVCGKDFETFAEYDERFDLSPPCRIAKKFLQRSPRFTIAS